MDDHLGDALKYLLIDHIGTDASGTGLKAMAEMRLPLEAINPEKQAEFVKMAIAGRIPNVASRVQEVEIMLSDRTFGTLSAVKIDNVWATFTHEGNDFPSEFFLAWLVLRAG